MGGFQMFGMAVKGLAVLLACPLVGCSAVLEAPKQISVAQIPVEQVAVTSAVTSAVTLLDKVVWNAQKQQGKMYRWGGTSPVTGFDCSGLTQYAFKNGAQVAIPRTAAEQYEAAVKVSREQSQKGDLVFFNTSGKRVSHVGIYLGNNKFVHAPRTGRAIATDQLKGYWANRLIGFGRIPGACRPSYS
jgi:cell wall-associated NlpC family hydrolase